MRKVIVVAVDFSDCSINAFEHAFSLAQKSKSDIKMVFVNKAIQEKSVALKDPEEAIADARSRFEEMISIYQPNLKNNVIEYNIRTGKVYREIIKQVKEDDAFLVVAGTHGSSGFEEFWIGSNAQKLVSASACPTITIGGGIKIDRNLTKIVLPIDSTTETRQKVPFTSLIAKYFDAKIYILSLYSTHVQAVRDRVDKYSEQVIEYLQENEIVYNHEVIEVDNITNDTIKYATAIEANLISIMTEQEKKTANLWLGPYAQQMINHSPIPVLSIHAKEYIRTLSR
ncbi:MAG: universal stress protein [Bacteroidales bacterium]|nr:universal stress protein [Bacteroidales bacterium]